MDFLNNFIDFTRKCYNDEENNIALHVPNFIGNEIKYLNETIKSTFVSSVGQYVDKIEKSIQYYTNTKKAVAVVNGTAAISVSLRLVGVKKEDEVLTQALTFVATANAISYNGASPVFIDVDIDTMGMSPRSLSKFLKEFGLKKDGKVFNKYSGKRIGAVLPMHTFGFLCRINEIKKICDEWGLPLVEDAAEAFGSKSNGISAGSYGTVGTFSFNGNKIITAGGGGVIVSNNLSLMERAKHLTTTAKKPHQYEYYHDEIGYNHRMPNINAALLQAQFESIEILKKSKSKLFNKYRSFFGQYKKHVKLFPIPETTKDWNYWLISILFNDKNDKDNFLKKTNSKGINTRPIWKLLFELPMYSDCYRDSQVNAKYLQDRVVNIPSSAI